MVWNRTMNDIECQAIISGKPCLPALLIGKQREDLRILIFWLIEWQAIIRDKSHLPALSIEKQWDAQLINFDWQICRTWALQCQVFNRFSFYLFLTFPNCVGNGMKYNHEWYWMPGYHMRKTLSTCSLYRKTTRGPPYFDILIDWITGYHTWKILSTCSKTMWHTRYLDPKEFRRRSPSSVVFVFSRKYKVSCNR